MEINPLLHASLFSRRNDKTSISVQPIVQPHTWRLYDNEGFLHDTEDTPRSVVHTYGHAQPLDFGSDLLVSTGVLSN